jgi:hypothetical protein
MCHLCNFLLPPDYHSVYGPAVVKSGNQGAIWKLRMRLLYHSILPEKMITGQEDHQQGRIP